MGRKFTKEEFMTKAYENNEHVRNGDIEIIGDYNGMNCHIEYLCHRCNTMQNPVAVSIMNGCGCKNCGSIQSHKTQSKSNKAFQDELQKKRDKIANRMVLHKNGISRRQTLVAKFNSKKAKVTCPRKI